MGGEWDRWGIECCWMEGSEWEGSGTGGGIECCWMEGSEWEGSGTGGV